MSLTTPNKEEKAWMDHITEIGCICCYRIGYRGTPGAVHHITSGGRRQSHLDTICLCDPGHHKNSPTPRKISYHHDKARFVAAYGTEDELLEYTKEVVKIEREIWNGTRQP